LGRTRTLALLRHRAGQGFRRRLDPGSARKDIRWQLAATRRADFPQERLQAVKSHHTSRSPSRRPSEARRTAYLDQACADNREVPEVDESNPYAARFRSYFQAAVRAGN